MHSECNPVMGRSRTDRDFSETQLSMHPDQRHLSDPGGSVDSVVEALRWVAHYANFNETCRRSNRKRNLDILPIRRSFQLCAYDTQPTFVLSILDFESQPLICCHVSC